MATKKMRPAPMPSPPARMKPSKMPAPMPSPPASLRGPKMRPAPMPAMPRMKPAMMSNGGKAKKGC